jgi:hypothetical protein
MKWTPQLRRDSAVAIAKMVRFHAHKGNCGNANSWFARITSQERKVMKKATIKRLDRLIDRCYVKFDPRKR